MAKSKEMAPNDDDPSIDDDEEMPETTDDSTTGASSSDDTMNTDDSDTDGDDDDDDDDDADVPLKADGAVNPRKYVLSEEDFIGDISLHPQSNLLAFGNLVGDIVVLQYSTTETTIVKAMECHVEPTRCVDFNASGTSLYSIAADKNIIITDTERWEMSQFFPSIHQDEPSAMIHVEENYIITGDSTGTVKLWDRRVKDRHVFESRKTRDSISSIVLTDDSRSFACAVDDGTLLQYDTRERRLITKTEPIESDVTAMGLFKGDSKLLCGTSSGVFYIYNWSNLNLVPDKFKTTKAKKQMQTESLIAATDNIAITGWENGVIRAMTIYPNKMIGIIGKAESDNGGGVHCLDVSHDGRYVAAASAQEISFWDISFLEHMKLACGGNSKDRNLPCSNINDRESFFSNLESKNPLEEACGEGGEDS